MNRFFAGIRQKSCFFSKTSMPCHIRRITAYQNFDWTGHGQDIVLNQFNLSAWLRLKETTNKARFMTTHEQVFKPLNLRGLSRCNSWDKPAIVARCCPGRHTKNLLAGHCSKQGWAVSKPHRSLRITASKSDMPERRIEFRNDVGELLVGLLTDTGSVDAVILCHGFASHKNGFHSPAIAEALRVKGLSSLRIDLSGNGESEGPFKYANIREEAADMHAAALILRSGGKKALGLMGHSKAGSGVLLYSAEHGDIPRVANVSGRFDHKRGLQKRFGEDVFEVVEKEGGKLATFKVEGGRKKDLLLDKKDLNDRMTIDMAEICSRISPELKILTIHGKEDETIPVADAQSFADRLPGGHICVIDGADHNYSKPEHAEKLIELLVDFFTKS